MKIATQWEDYKIIATGNGEKLEKWGPYYLLRPDPQIIWKNKENLENFSDLDAHYIRSAAGGGHWINKNNIPDEWNIKYKNLTFAIKPMGFKHTGLFPEQAVNWEIMMNLIKKVNRPIKILNLFAYTGGATVACCSVGANVTHVDCVKQIVERAKINMELSGLKDANVRYIVDDCKKFVEREIRRGNKYDAIIMDPPSYGKSGNSTWKLENDLFDFVKLCNEILVEKPLFVLINSYTTGLSKIVVENIMKLCLINKSGVYESYEVGLLTKENIVLPCGSSSLFIGK